MSWAMALGQRFVTCVYQAGNDYAKLCAKLPLRDFISSLLIACRMCSDSSVSKPRLSRRETTCCGTRRP